MLLSWNGVYESKELHKMEETKEKETKEKLKLSTIRIVVISETCLLITNLWFKPTKNFVAIRSEM